jgi:hypothetical protein
MNNIMNIKDDISSKNLGNRYVKYNNIHIDNVNNENKKNNKKKLLSNLSLEEKMEYENSCLKVCEENENCGGLNIDDEDGCGLIKKIDNRNKIIEKENNTAHIKDDNVKNYNNDDEYLIKLENEKFITTKDEYGQTILTSTDNMDKAKKFKFNKNNNIINVEKNKCVQSNGMYLIINDCDNNNTNQKFIVENKLNTLRNYNNDCLTSQNGNITLNKCNNSLIENNPQSVKIKVRKEENYKSQLNNNENNNKICSNNTHKLIINIVIITIALIIIYYILKNNEER